MTHYSRIAAVAVLPLVLAGAASAASNESKPAPNWTSLPGGTWESIAKLPDWTGVWDPFRYNNESQPTTRSTPPLTPAGQAKLAEIRDIDEAGGDKFTRNLRCVTRGLPGDMGSAESILQFGYTPGQIMITMVEGSVRHIYTDGRPHIDPVAVVHTFQGDSIGHWEGDTLVVDTTAIDAGNEFISGLPQGNDSHVVERLRLVEPDHLRDEIMIEAPEVIVGQFKYNLHYERHRDWQMLEFDCNQNNADLDWKTGKQIFPQPPP